MYPTNTPVRSHIVPGMDTNKKVSTIEAWPEVTTALRYAAAVLVVVVLVTEGRGVVKTKDGPVPLTVFGRFGCFSVFVWLRKLDIGYKSVYYMCWICKYCNICVY